MKHLHSFVPFALSVMIGLMVCVTEMYAAGETYDLWDGSAVAVTPVGTTYTVSSAAELAWIAQQNDAEGGFAGKTIVLDANIDLGGSNRLRVWTPIGSAAHPFAGSFNGRNHLIRGLGTFNAEDGIGVFGYVAAAGRIDSIGISGGRVIAVAQHYVGTLAGVCAGQINGCWSMAEIAMAGDVVGGLVGEMTAGSALTDAYCCSLIRNAGDTVGVLIGRNAGSITRAYTTGYAKNGCAFVGTSRTEAAYSQCYYDRKLYFQEPGVLSSGLTPVNDTYEMFQCLAADSRWHTNAKRYPELQGFVGTDASALSVVPAFVDTTQKNPVNHANDLTVDFTVDTTQGVRWTNQDINGSEWIAFSGNRVQVTRPCTETDVLTTAAMADEKRTVYFRPRRLEELKEGEFRNKETPSTVCWDADKELRNAVYVELAKDGFGQHHYMIVRYGYDASNKLYPIDTICTDKVEDEFLLWFRTATVHGDSVGNFALRAFVHDDRCVPDWMPCNKQYDYTVLPELNPGSIPTQWDTVYMTNGKAVIHIPELTPASGGDGKYDYSWRVAKNGVNFIAHTGKSGDLTYTFTEAINRRNFFRYVNDSSQCGGKNADGVYTVTVFEEFKAGSVSALSKRMFCTVDDARMFIVKASPATGGSGNYLYQWYLESGSTLTPIAGQTNCNLSLAGLSLTAGGDYTFVRKAQDDTRFTDWTLTDKKQAVHILPELSAGAIESADRGRRCEDYDASGTATITITVNETTPASGETVLMQYRWLRISGTDTTVVGSTPSLSYTWTIDGSNSYIMYTYVREVQHGDCGWVRSAGEVTEEYGLKDKGAIKKTVCESQMPFTMHWKDSKGNDFSHTFNANGETWVVTDAYNATGCPADTTVTINVVERPTISTEKEAKFCQSESQITLYIDQTEGDPDMFYILYSPDFAKVMGRKDTLGYITNPGTIIVRNVPPIPEGDHYMDVQVGITGGAFSLLDVECYSPISRVTIVASLGGYVHSKFSRVLFVDNNPANGEVPAPKLHFKAYQWFKNGVAVEGAVGQYYQENGQELKGVYYCRLTDDSGKTYRSCDREMPDEAVASSAAPPAVYPVPATAGEPVTLTCYGGQIEICACTGEVVLRADCPEDAVTLTAPRTAGIYYVRISHPDGLTQTEKLIVK